jgi:hypothetical protein
MSSKKYLSSKFCCGCERRLDRLDRSKLIKAKIEDNTYINTIRQENEKTIKVISGDDLLCTKCYNKLSRKRKSEQGIVTLESDRDFVLPSTSRQVSSSVPQTSSPVAKRVALNPPVSSSGSSENSPPSSPQLNSTFEDLEVECEQRQSMVIDIPITSKSHSRCLICPTVRKNLRRISPQVQIDFMIKNGIWISEESRLCAHHFRENNTLKPEHEDLITTTSDTSIWTPNEVLSLIDRLRDRAQEKPESLFENIDSVSEETCKNITGLDKFYFKELFKLLPSLNKFKNTYNPIQMLATFLFRLKNGISLNLIATIFKLRSFQTVGRMINETRKCITEDLVSQKLGLVNMDRTDLMNAETTWMARKILNSGDSLITIWDGTYAYCQKSSNYYMQRQTYSLQKKRHLVKPFIGITTNGRYLDVWEPNDALSNDASIMNNLLKKESFRNFFKKGDIFVVDRGFRDSLREFERYGFRYEMPAYLARGQKQLTCQEANRSRKVTKVRYAVEVAIGRLKQFKYLDKIIQNSTLPHIFEDFRIVAAILNAQYNDIESDVRHRVEIANKILERENIPNTLVAFVDSNNLDTKRAPFKKIESCEINDFPKLEFQDLYFITLGTYQLKQSLSYIAQHLDENGLFFLEAFKDNNVKELNGNSLIRAKLQSRHSKSTKYNIYIQYDPTRDATDAIIMWLCRCKNGQRTLGCCAHVASVIYYFAFGRYQESIKTPAAFLTNLFPHAHPVLHESSDEESQPVP